jgi:hypothetical protein
MAAGWDVLLHGERSASGRMDLGDGRLVRGWVRQPVGLGVRVSCEVVGEGPLGSDQILKTSFEQRRRACEMELSVRTANHLPPQISIGG